MDITLIYIAHILHSGGRYMDLTKRMDYSYLARESGDALVAHNGDSAGRDVRLLNFSLIHLSALGNRAAVPLEPP